MVVAEVSITPSTDNLTEYVQRAVAALNDSGLKVVTGPMGSIIEGELDDVLAAVKAAHITVRDSCDARHVITQVRLDDKLGGTSIEDKLEDV